MTTQTRKTLLSKEVRDENNRKNFVDTMDAVARGHRGGLFSIPLGTTIGDTSTFYARDRKNEDETGKKRGFANGRGRINTTDPFNKITSNAIGDPYQDAGKYHLRSTSGLKAHAGPFNPSGSGGKLLGPIQMTDKREFPLHQPGPNNNSKRWLASNTKTNSNGFG